MGGPSPTFSLKEFQAAFDEGYYLGVNHGEERAAKLLREQIRHELESELTNIGACPMCQLRAEHRDQAEQIQELERTIRELHDRIRAGRRG